MSAQSDLSQLRQRAAEMILGTPDLTDELTDAAAWPLIRWGLAQAEVVAERLQAANALEVLAAAPGLADSLADGMSHVRRVIKAVNRLAAERHELEPAVVAEELAYIFELATQLPNPPPAGVLRTTMAELAGWQREMDTMAFLWALLTLLGAEPEIEQHSGDQELRGGETDGKDD
jgi:hypothetical protein